MSATSHLATELLMSMAGIKLTHVPYTDGEGRQLGNRLIEIGCHEPSLAKLKCIQLSLFLVFIVYDSIEYAKIFHDV